MRTKGIDKPITVTLAYLVAKSSTSAVTLLNDVLKSPFARKIQGEAIEQMKLIAGGPNTGSAFFFIAAVPQQT
jgi:hypothetical protein